MKNKTCVICVSFEEEELKSLEEKLQEIDLNLFSRIHWVHVFHEVQYSYVIEAYHYPLEEHKPDIEKNFIIMLQGLADRVDAKLKDKTQVKCLFATSPRQRMVDYLAEVRADYALVLTPEKSGLDGLFGGSFSEYLLKHAPCHVLALRA